MAQEGREITGFDIWFGFIGGVIFYSWLIWYCI